jgi:hypothetical protein
MSCASHADDNGRHAKEGVPGIVPGQHLSSVSIMHQSHGERCRPGLHEVPAASGIRYRWIRPCGTRMPDAEAHVVNRGSSMREDVETAMRGKARRRPCEARSAARIVGHGSFHHGRILMAGISGL